MMKVLLLVVFGLLMHAAREFAPASGTFSSPAATTLAAGYLLLTAFLTGSLFKRFGLPKLTGYLAAGIVVGPQVLGLLDGGMVLNLRIFNGVAVALIALTAGTEMHMPTMRPLFRSIAWITLFAVLGTTVLLSLVVYLARPLMPFMADLAAGQAIALALVLGVTMVAQSPSVVVALRDETDADGPLIRTVMGVVVLADLVVILMFAVVSSLAQGAFGAQTDILATAGKLSWELFGSMGAGVVVGLFIAAYLRRVKTSGALFVVAVAFVVAEVGARMHLDPLIVALAAGILIRNFTDLGERLHHEIEQASLPVYVAFFGVAGATIHLDVLATVGPAAALFVVTRAVGFQIGNRMAARRSGAPDVVRRFGGSGLMPQAGLALALALLFTKTFPQFGEPAAALVFGVVALNELIAPVLFRISLVKSGEAGKRTAAARPDVAAAPVAPASPDPAPG
ncbi:MAG TPA: cation:proton antiporter [Kofleriaceae bacterium]|nr:cation:proton antiporter [Kofleriaceae bacterium]